MQDPWLPLDSCQCHSPNYPPGIVWGSQAIPIPNQDKSLAPKPHLRPAQRRMKQGIGSCSKVMPSLQHLKEDGRWSHPPDDYLLSPADPAVRRKGAFCLHVSEARRKTQHCLPRFIYLGDLCGICLPVCLWDAQCLNKSHLGPGEYFRTIPSVMTESDLVLFYLIWQSSAI